MGGLANLFKKLIPFILTICMVCLGITHAFNPSNDKNLTYLKKQYYDIETGNVIENPTQNQIENAEELYTFDMVNYVKNFDINIITRSTKDVIDIEAYTETANEFSNIWDDGYQIGDILATIFNGILMVINTIILIINIFLLPLRIISGILLTAMSLIGININNGIVIIPFLKVVIDYFRIPFIRVANEKQPNQLTSTTWTLQESKIVANAPTIVNKTTNTKACEVNFTVQIKPNKLQKFNRIEVSYFKNIFGKKYIKVEFINTKAKENGEYISLVVYDNGVINLNYMTITITDTNLSAKKITEVTTFLDFIATRNT